jgi:predicted DNA-binding transcriptional regulator AlpA
MQCVEDTRELFSIKELSILSGISVKTLYRYLVNIQHPLPHYRIGPGGSIIRVKKRDFEKWLSNQKVPGKGS